MRYLVLLAQDEAVWPSLTEAEQQAYMDAHVAFDRAVRERATAVAGEALGGSDTATTLRHDAADRPVLTDGPYAEVTEQLGGFYLIDAPDLDTMVSLCEHLPHAYTIEIRPVIDMDPAAGAAGG